MQQHRLDSSVGGSPASAGLLRHPKHPVRTMPQYWQRVVPVANRDAIARWRRQLPTLPGFGLDHASYNAFYSGGLISRTHFKRLKFAFGLESITSTATIVPGERLNILTARVTPLLIINSLCIPTVTSMIGIPSRRPPNESTCARYREATGPSARLGGNGRSPGLTFRNKGVSGKWHFQCGVVDVKARRF